MAGLLSLPNEMLLMIAESNLSQTDLKSLRLAHPSLSGIARKPLFRTVSIKIKSFPKTPDAGPKDPPVSWICTVGDRTFPISWISNVNNTTVVCFQPHSSINYGGKVAVGANPFGEQDKSQPPWESVRELKLVARVPERIPMRSIVEKVTDSQLAVINFAHQRMRSLEVLRWTARCIHLSTKYTFPENYFDKLETHIKLRAWREIPAGHNCCKGCVGKHLSRPTFLNQTFRNITHLTITEAFYITTNAEQVCTEIADLIAQSPGLQSLTFETNRVDEQGFLTIDQGLMLTTMCERYPGDDVPLPITRLTVPMLTSQSKVINEELSKLRGLKKLVIQKPAVIYQDLPDENTASLYGIVLEDLTLPLLNPPWLAYLRSPQLNGVLKRLDIHLLWIRDNNARLEPLEDFWISALPALGEGGLEELHLRSCISSPSGYTPRASPQTKSLRSCASLKTLTISPGCSGRVYAMQLLELAWSVKEHFLPELERLNMRSCRGPERVCGGCAVNVRIVQDAVCKFSKRKCGNLRNTVVATTGMPTRDGLTLGDTVWKWRQVKGNKGPWGFVEVRR